jgi:large subunit ribosomal protein L21
MDYSIIKLGNKQHRVRDGERLVVDRLPAGEGESFEPVVLLGESKVTATVLAHGRGPKILIGKYRKRTGYKRHTGFRAATTQVEIALGGGAAKAQHKPARTAKQAEAPAAEAAAPVAEPTVTAPVPVEADPAASPGLPAGYDGMTVAQVSSGAKEWSLAEVQAALAYEQAHAARKGAIAALEAAIAKESADGA